MQKLDLSRYASRRSTQKHAGRRRRFAFFSNLNHEDGDKMGLEWYQKNRFVARNPGVVLVFL